MGGTNARTRNRNLTPSEFTRPNPPLQVLREKVTFRTMTARNDSYKVPLSPQAAKEGVDAFAKELYAKQFLWLVSKINEATSAGQEHGRTGVIGLLDIFGFESFKVNR